jgi:hypothetical protein
MSTPENVNFLAQKLPPMMNDGGNYGEIYERGLGSSPMRLPRGENNLRAHGGAIATLPPR